MNKIKIVLFGAANAMFQAANEHLRHDNCEIIAFCDNNEYKQGLIWNDLPVLSVSQLKNLDYDFIIVGAWYSYNVIRKSLLNAGIPDTKIMPLLSLKTVILLTDSIPNFPESILEKIFRSDPKRLNSKITEINQINEMYLNLQPLEIPDDSINFVDYPLIAHASGGSLPGDKLIYTNSVEAFQTSIENGFKMIEVDVWGIIDEDLIFGHDSKKLKAAATSNYTSLTFTHILSVLAENPQLKVMLDIKWSTLFNYKQVLDKMETILLKSGAKWNYEIKQQLVVQVYDLETTEYAVKQGWQCVLINYRSPDGSWFQKTAYLCCKFNLLGAIFGSETLLTVAKYLKFLKDKNIPIIAYTTDDIEEYSKLKKIGVTSVITNFLSPHKS